MNKKPNTKRSKNSGLEDKKKTVLADNNTKVNKSGDDDDDNPQVCETSSLLPSSVKQNDREIILQSAPTSVTTDTINSTNEPQKMLYSDLSDEEKNMLNSSFTDDILAVLYQVKFTAPCMSLLFCILAIIYTTNGHIFHKFGLGNALQGATPMLDSQLVCIFFVFVYYLIFSFAFLIYSIF